MKGLRLLQLSINSFLKSKTFSLSENSLKYYHSYALSLNVRQQINCSCSVLPEIVLKTQERGYAKSKDKVKGGKQTNVNLSDEELEQVVDVGKFKKELDNIFENLKVEYINNLSIRTSLGALENIPVELEGEKYNLNEIAQVIRKSPILVVINASDFPQAAANIRKAIEESGMNLNPRQDGTTIYVPIPKVTKEYREGLAHNAKTLFEKSKGHVRDVQNKYVKKIKGKDGSVSDDLLYNAQLKIREIATSATSQLEALMKNKQDELLKK